MKKKHEKGKKNKRCSTFLRKWNEFMLDSIFA